MQKQLNLFGLVGGITILLLIAVSVFVPWWQLTIGSPVIMTANTSPLNTNFNFLGDSFTIPLIMAFNIAAIISLAAGGVVILIYSINPSKSYSAKLLSFAYRKPLYSVILFVAGLFLVLTLMQSFLGLSVPIVGSTNSKLSGGIVQGVTQGLTINVLMSAEFVWPFWLAIVAAGLCIAARFYHKKIAEATLPNNKELAQNAQTARMTSA